MQDGWRFSTTPVRSWATHVRESRRRVGFVTLFGSTITGAGCCSVCRVFCLGEPRQSSGLESKSDRGCGVITNFLRKTSKQCVAVDEVFRSALRRQSSKAGLIAPESFDSASGIAHVAATSNLFRPYRSSSAIASARFWMEAPAAQKQKLQTVLSRGVRLKDGRFGTAVTCLAFKKLDGIGGSDSGMASSTGFAVFPHAADCGATPAGRMRSAGSETNL
jgi:hypothetical protein